MVKKKINDLNKNTETTLDVGGHLFKTTTDILDNFDYVKEKFEKQKDSNPETKNRKIFIDRDPKHFRMILNYVRGMEYDDLSDQLETWNRKDLLELSYR
eukprot:UN13860